MISRVTTTILRSRLALDAQGRRATRALDRRLTARAGQSAVEWMLITSTIAVGLAAVLGLLNGAINEYFTALIEWLRAHKPV